MSIAKDYQDAVVKLFEALGRPQRGDLLCFDGEHWQIAKWHGYHYPVDDPKTAATAERAA